MVNKENYKLALDNIKASQKLKEKTASKMKAIAKDGKTNITLPSTRILASACAVLIMALIAFTPGINSLFGKAETPSLNNELKDEIIINGSKITILDKAPRVRKSLADYQPVTEQQIFEETPHIIYGKVVGLKWLKISKAGGKPPADRYWTVISLKADKAYKGTFNTGDIVDVVVSFIVGSKENYWIEDNKVISSLNIGDEGFFFIRECSKEEVSKYPGTDVQYGDIRDYRMQWGDENVIVKRLDGSYNYLSYTFSSFNDSKVSYQDVENLIYSYIK